MRKAITNWVDCGRDDLNMIPVMETNGFKAEFKPSDVRAGRIVPENCPHDAVSFVKGNLHVWKCYKNSESYWQTAELIDGYYCNHKPVDNLSDLFLEVSN